MRTQKAFLIQHGQTLLGIWDEHFMNSVLILWFYKQKIGLEPIQFILELDGVPLMDLLAGCIFFFSDGIPN